MTPLRCHPTIAALLLLAVVACGGEPGPAGETDLSKETIPLAEEETNPRETMRSATGEFNSCLEASGYEFAWYIFGPAEWNVYGPGGLGYISIYSNIGSFREAKSSKGKQR